jgi:hypothetical protein
MPIGDDGPIASLQAGFVDRLIRHLQLHAGGIALGGHREY